MGKTKRKAGKRAVRRSPSSSTYDAIIKNCRREMELHVAAWEDQVNSKIQELFNQMHSLISSLPPEVAQMSVGDYIKQFLEYAEEESASSDEQPLQAIQNNTAATPRPKPQRKAPQTRQKVKRKQPPPSTSRMTRSKKMFETPSHRQTPLVVVEGTPMLTRKPTSQLQLSEKPRQMRNTDDISALGLTAYSSRGSPMMINNMDVDLHRKIQESLQLLMQGPP